MRKRIPHCSHWGAYTLLVEDGRIVGSEPFADDPDPSPIVGSVPEWTKPERRVLRPMVREGWRPGGGAANRERTGNDRFVPIEWDEALTLVSAEINRVAGDHGNASIFAGSYGWTSCGRFHHAATLLKRLMNLVGGYTGHVDTYSIAAGPAILRHVLGDADACMGRATTLDTLIGTTETLVVFGALSPRTAQVEAGGAPVHGLPETLRKLRAAGTRIIHVSPCREDMPDWMQAEWWPIRPNTDAALMLGMAGEILRAGRHDQAFLQRCTSGAERFLGYLAGKSDGVAKTADWAAEITGLPADDIRALSQTLVETRSFLSLSWALQRAHHGEHTYWAALGLAAMIGQIGLRGGGVGYGYGSLNGIGGPFGTGVSPAMSQGRKPIDSFIPVARISDLLLSPGARFSYQGETRTYPDIRLVYWAGGNPYHHHQDLNRLQEAWNRPETIIVQDPMMTPTARRADILLPASTSLERNDISGTKRSDVYVAMHQAIEPMGEARSDYRIFSDLARHLGVQADFTEGRDEMAWIRHLYDTSAAYERRAHGVTMPDFDTFWARGSARVTVKRDNVHLAGFREQPEQHPLATESGKIVLGSDRLAALALPDCPDHPTWMEPAEWLGMPAADGRLHLLSSQPQGRLHSQLDTGPASLAHRRNGREQLRIHPEDARARQIGDGDTVRLWNDRGQCLATASLTENLGRGVVVLPVGAWLTPDGRTGLDLAGNPNVLTLDIPSSGWGQGPSAHTCMVHVEPATADPTDSHDIYLKQIEEQSI
ncbi:molybdopterin-dependent oxidoreductase [Microbulbifer sp. S227A]|uniref:molybdopterin-dependent oxidoreductase n=1 Tax=Microbulbifer sp. S227A TaxID=3415131 RepID=UPI003C7CA2B2